MDFAERARALIGTPFRLQGRSREGADCIGVAILAFDIPDESFRRNYRLRGDHAGEARHQLQRFFRHVPATQLRSGDLMLMQVSSDQLHLGVRTGRGFVHAHAGLRRVVETPGVPDWPVLGVYRRRKG
jgi:cell wall-associated NlpC family hydrolase